MMSGDCLFLTLFAKQSTNFGKNSQKFLNFIQHPKNITVKFMQTANCIFFTDLYFKIEFKFSESFAILPSLPLSITDKERHCLGCPPKIFFLALPQLQDFKEELIKNNPLAYVSNPVLELMKMGRSMKILFLIILCLLVMRPLEEHFSVFSLPGRHQSNIYSYLSSYFLPGITLGG